MLSPKERSEAIERFAKERGVSVDEAAQALSLNLPDANKTHIPSTVRGLTLCGLSSFAVECVMHVVPSTATCLRCRRFHRHR